MALVITSINAVPDFTTMRPDGTLSNARIEDLIWNGLGNYDDGTGSTRPITFEIPNVAPPSYAVKVLLQGICQLPPSYANASYTVCGTLLTDDGQSVTVFKSSPLKAPPIIPQNGVQVLITPDTLNVPAPTPSIACPVLFRWAGDFSWKIKPDGLPGM